MKRFLIEFMFVNCRNDSPTEALKRRKTHQIKKDRIESLDFQREYNVGNLPTKPNKTQYTAANIVNGIDAKKAPNFPAKSKQTKMLKTEQLYKVIALAVICYY